MTDNNKKELSVQERDSIKETEIETESDNNKSPVLSAISAHIKKWYPDKDGFSSINVESGQAGVIR